MLNPLSIPFEPKFFGWTPNIHLVLEYLAFFVGFRYYIFLRRRAVDTISTPNRLSIILGAAIGAFFGSRIMGFLENPTIDLSTEVLIRLYNVKTIMGGLFGGLLGVEVTKHLIGEKESSGDLFTLPIILAIIIGRIGCFLAGTNEFTYGTETSFLTAMDLGDGLMRHPIALYEIVFLVFLFFLIRRLFEKREWPNGTIFRFFMLAYFGFRFLLEFIKPNVFTFFGLSSIQWLCIFCFVYFRATLSTLARAYT